MSPEPEPDSGLATAIADIRVSLAILTERTSGHDDRQSARMSEAEGRIRALELKVWPAVGILGLVTPALAAALTAMLTR